MRSEAIRRLLNNLLVEKKYYNRKEMYQKLVKLLINFIICLTKGKKEFIMNLNITNYNKL